MTYSTSQKLRRDESMENNIDLSFSEIKERKQNSFAENRYTEQNIGKSTDLQDLELDEMDSENKLKFNE